MTQVSVLELYDTECMMRLGIRNMYVYAYVPATKKLSRNSRPATCYRDSDDELVNLGLNLTIMTNEKEKPCLGARSAHAAQVCIGTYYGRGE